MKKNKGSKKARSGAARLSAVQTVYQMRFSDTGALEASRDFLGNYAGMDIGDEKLLEPDTELYGMIVRGVDARKDDLKSLMLDVLSDGSRGGAGKEIEPLLESIIYCGLFEIIANRETDAPVIISGYLEVTHAFYDKKEAGLVNAILDKTARNVRHN